MFCSWHVRHITWNTISITWRIVKYLLFSQQRLLQVWGWGNINFNMRAQNVSSSSWSVLSLCHSPCRLRAKLFLAFIQYDTTVTYGRCMLDRSSHTHIFQNNFPKPNAVTKWDLQVLTVRQVVRNYSVTYRQRLDDHPNSLTKSLLQRTNCNRRLKRHYPADLATRF